MSMYSERPKQQAHLGTNILTIAENLAVFGITNNFVTKIAYAEYVGEITENRLTGSDISIDIFSN